MEPDISDRRTWMSRLACAPAGRLETLWRETGRPAAFDWLRAPEIGTVMVRGRAGGTGAPFNLGEMTVTRCSLRTADGAVGHAVVQGRDKGAARVAALVDALMQTEAAADLRAEILVPLGEAAEAACADRAQKAAATRVDFFTMARGET